MRSGWRAWVEDKLPWYSPQDEQSRNARTEAIRRRSIAARVQSERVIAEYRKAIEGRRREAMVDEVRRK